MFRQWKRNVLRSWKTWWDAHRTVLKTNNKSQYELLWHRGIKACEHALRSTFWSWPLGSGVFYWRLPNEFSLDLAIGVRPLWVSKPIDRILEQANLGDQNMITMISHKISDVRAKGYIAPGECLATMIFFAVPKGDDDIRMVVYDGTKSGLNEALYAPWFPLPDGDTLTNTLDDGYRCIDNDYGEMFLNFWLHPELQSYSGMDFSALYEHPASLYGLKYGVAVLWARVPLLIQRSNKCADSNASSWEISMMRTMCFGGRESLSTYQGL
ncbi:hypothetical protein ACA910_018706 [Epithemia clementina (nom. ined.)]